MEDLHETADDDRSEPAHRPDRQVQPTRGDHNHLGECDKREVGGAIGKDVEIVCGAKPRRDQHKAARKHDNRKNRACRAVAEEARRHGPELHQSWFLRT